MCGIAGGAFVARYIFDDVGYYWTFGVCGILFSVLLFVVILLVPETFYNRDALPTPVLRPQATPSDHKEKLPAVDEKSPNHAVESGIKMPPLHPPPTPQKQS
ncbi:hypothetical protein AJ80_01445 [Polytolypa hystricis UAMH7299]|uniref:Major facilitator superfamily (MFS) profile domain-containing protein n=1 Tax=Polytolypa hystricis (strain UAMH7299) TaxID=1447883 RepID=A0A2B7Z0W0_POLH7|nr:hypothetical protein AJ80_01445 [Polytolypa hystricis UAMH7299]